jgi:hypothetical protein
VSLPPTVNAAPNTVCVIQPGMNVQAVCVISPPATATLTTGSGGKSNVSVNVQPGMLVRPVVLVTSAGQFTS